MKSIKTEKSSTPVEAYFTFVGIAIFVNYLLYGVFQGIINPIPALGDSYDYHIPIQQMILNGSFLNPTVMKLPQWYSPGSTEALNAVFIALHIPLTLSNIAAILFFTIMLWKLSNRFLKDYYISLFVTIFIVGQNAVLRWMNAVSIDVWMAGFYSYLLYLVLGKLSSNRDYFLLGFSTGMVLGSKYPAIAVLLITFVLFGKEFVHNLTPKKFGIFLIPVTLLGLFWYMRNYLSIGNPIYPLPLFSLPSYPVYNDTILDEIIKHPILVFNAFISEYKLATILLLGSVVIGVKGLIHDRNLIKSRFFILGILFLILFLFYPTSSQPWIIVSSFRYTYLLVLVLLIFIFPIIKEHKLYHYALIFCLLNLSVITSLAYTPKLLFLTLIVCSGLFYALLNKRKWIEKYILGQSTA